MLVSALLLSGLIAGARWQNELGLSGSYFQQRYNLVDTITRDTSEADAEIASFWSVSLNPGLVANEPQLDNTLTVASNSIRERLGFNLVLSPQIGRAPESPLKFKLAYDGELRYFHNRLPVCTDTTGRASYVNNLIQGEINFRVRENLAIGCGEALELHRYFTADSFNYNYYRNRLRAGLDFTAGAFSSFSFVYYYSWLGAEQVAAQGYQEHTLDANWDGYPGTVFRLGLANYFARRRYREGAKSYFEENPAVTLDWDIVPPATIVFTGNLRLVWYDETTAVYQNQVDGNFSLALSLQPGAEVSVNLGPELARSRGLVRSTDQDYQEIALRLGVDWFRSERLALTVEDRLGLRKYAAADSGFISDYRFNEINLFGNWEFLSTARGGFVLSGMLNIAPEWHANTADNLAAVSYSLELKYRW